MSMDKTDADVAFIRALAAILTDSDLGEIEVEREYGEDDELKVRLSRQSSVAPPAMQAAPQAMLQVPSTIPAPAAPTPAAAATSPDPASAAGMVPSPMVGTAYMAAEPDAAPFVKEGDAVTKGQTIMIIEAMKTMNQIPAPRAGTVVSIIVGNGDPVEFGMPLMIIE